MSDPTKCSIYREAGQRIAGLVSGLNDPIAAMASAAAVLFEILPSASWVGFYRVVEPELLRIGPYQGPVGCLEIPFGKGVCGTAARERRTQIVADVHTFPGHIACDSLALSEIVVPVLDDHGVLVAVLDLDSHHLAAFDREDGEHLETIVSLLRSCITSQPSI